MMIALAHGVSPVASTSPPDATLLPRECGRGRHHRLVATGVFGLVWLLAPSHGLIARILARRRATALAEPPSPVFLERDAHIAESRKASGRVECVRTRRLLRLDVSFGSTRVVASRRVFS